MNNQQPKKNPEPAPAANQVMVIPANMVAAWFTAHELLALQRSCRDSDDENTPRFLAAAIRRADRSK